MKPKKTDLVKKLSELEDENDALITELSDLDELMRKVGFPAGIEDLKETAQDLNSREKGMKGIEEI